MEKQLRLGIYEALLIVAEGTPKQDGVPRLHPAVLRTSRQVYSEAISVLYKQNKFRAKIVYAEQLYGSIHSSMIPVCELVVYRPGGECFFRHRNRMSTGHLSLLHSLFCHSATVHMLHMLTHLTIDIDLVTPRGKQGSHDYSVKACDTMKTLCLLSAGASKLQELSIVFKPGDQDSSDIDLADILWPLLLLRSDIRVNFQGVTAEPEKTSTESGPGIDAAFCRRIAHLRQLCSGELKRPGWEERHWAFHGLREAETALYALEIPDKRLCLYDIVSMSAV